jgi:DUF1365 family protein
MAADAQAADAQVADVLAVDALAVDALAVDARAVASPWVQLLSFRDETHWAQPTSSRKAVVLHRLPIRSGVRVQTSR